MTSEKVQAAVCRERSERLFLHRGCACRCTLKIAVERCPMIFGIPPFGAKAELVIRRPARTGEHRRGGGRPQKRKKKGTHPTECGPSLQRRNRGETIN